MQKGEPEFTLFQIGYFVSFGLNRLYKNFSQSALTYILLDLV